MGGVLALRQCPSPLRASFANSAVRVSTFLCLAPGIPDVWCTLARVYPPARQWRSELSGFGNQKEQT